VFNKYAYGADNVNKFRSEKHWYGKTDKRVQIVDVDCNKKLIDISEPIDSASSTFKKIVTGKKMNSLEIKLYCETDYTKQYNIYSCKKSKAMNMRSSLSRKHREKELTIQEARDVDISCSE